MYVRKNEDIEEISEWLRQSKFLPDYLSKPIRSMLCSEGPDVIYLFLSSVNGDISKTKTILSNYYYVRQSIPELFTNRNAILKKNFLAWKGSCFFPLKGKAGGHQIFLGAVLDGNLYDFEVFAKQMYMCYDLLIMTNDWDTGSRILVFSYHTSQYRNLASYTMYLTKKTIECQTKNYLPGKMKEIHNVHVQPYLKNLLVELKEKVKSENCEVFIHKNIQSLHKYINPELLPLELGGSAGSLQSIADRWFQIIKLHKDFFEEEERKRIQETKAHRQ